MGENNYNDCLLLKAQVNEMMSCRAEVSQHWLIVFVTQTLETQYLTALPHSLRLGLVSIWVLQPMRALETPKPACGYCRHLIFQPYFKTRVLKLDNGDTLRLSPPSICTYIKCTPYIFKSTKALMSVW